MSQLDLPLAPHAASARDVAAVARRLATALERDVFPILILGGFAVLLLALLSREVAQDTWLTLVDGRFVAHAGLPRRDSLAVWTAGARWIDQQWLAQLALFGAARLGGLKLVLLAHVALVAAAFAGAAAVARRRGASPRAVAVAAGLGIAAACPGFQVRAQSFAYVLFVVVYALAVRRPDRRTLVVLPVLVVWANLHGSVVLGAALVVLAGGVGLVTARRSARAYEPRVGALLVAAAPLALLASPYAAELPSYYRAMLLDPAFAPYVSEWQRLTPSPATMPFLALCLVLIVLMIRARHTLTSFEWLALPLLTLAGLAAFRNVVWLGLASAISLPRLLDTTWPERANRPLRRGLNLVLASGTCVAVAAVAVAVAARPLGWYERQWPVAAARVVAATLDGDPDVRVLADDRHADWLLWRIPALAGRLAFDTRLELMTPAQLRAWFEFGTAAGGGGDALRQYRLLTFDRDAAGRHAANQFLRERGARLLYRDATIEIVLRRSVR